MRFRYDIGFLRALAVFIVVFFHYKIPFFQGGFIGVDIFFVISGFLMTSIILKGFDKDFFSIKDFYIRRFERIVPALAVMMLCVLIITFFIYFPVDLKQVSIYTFFSGLFLSNYYYLFNSDYFDASSQTNILLHTWSLSVEWQFYIIYPLFLVLLKKFYLKRKKEFNAIFLAITLFSFLLVIVFNNFLPSSYSKISFFSFTHRAWEMMFGGMAFLYKDFFENKISDFFKNILIGLSIIVIAISIVCLNETYAWPSSLTLLPVIGTFLVIALNKEYNFYKNSTIQYIGNISYSWYLWHWPICVIARYFDYKGVEVTALLIVISLLLASLSYELIEKRSKLVSLKKMIIGSSFVILISLIGIFGTPNKYLFSKDAVLLSEYKDHYDENRRKQFHSGVCHNVSKVDYKKCLCINIKKKNILLLGDSHAGQFSLSFRKKLDSTKFNFMEHTVVGSFPLINAKGEKRATGQFKSIFNKFIVEHKSNIDVVLLSCNWMNYPNSAGYTSNEELVNDVNATINELKKMGIKKVLVMGQGEEYNIDYPRVIAFNLEGKLGKSYVNQESVILNNDLKKLVPPENYINIFLDNKIKHYDPVNKVPYMFDDDHMTIYGADQIVDLLLKKNIF
jgi:peptidoglycan/LPS O-acetylase OafA/YrhL